MKNLGLTALQEQKNSTSYDAGVLSGMFREGGVSEITPIADMSSVGHILRDDKGAGHLAQDSNDIRQLHVARTGDIQDHQNETIFKQSLRQTVYEQDGAKSDPDTVTDEAYLKQGISDPGGHEKTEDAKRRKDHRHVLNLTEQERIAQRLAELDMLIEAAKQKIAGFNEDIAETEDIQEIINSGDINENSAAGRARRERVVAWARERNIDLDKAKNPDGFFDKAKLLDISVEHKQATEANRTQENAKLNAYNKEYAKITQDGITTADAHNADNFASEQRTTAENKTHALPIEKNLPTIAELDAAYELSSQNNDEAFSFTAAEPVGAVEDTDFTFAAAEPVGAVKDTDFTFAAAEPVGTSDETDFSFAAVDPVGTSNVSAMSENNSNSVINTTESNVVSIASASGSVANAIDGAENKQIITAFFSEAASNQAVKEPIPAQENTAEQRPVYTSAISYT